MKGQPQSAGLLADRFHLGGRLHPQAVIEAGHADPLRCHLGRAGEQRQRVHPPGHGQQRPALVLVEKLSQRGNDGRLGCGLSHGGGRADAG
ncbi:MAG TPA: hypothetical protein VEL75_04925, partial [Candidatus Methylomirabilis sp.]|nr:hypothetical protein [Candidatus Methylomirabilis sp.]